MKNPLTLAGMEPATFRFVAQHLNHCATAVALKGKVGPFKRKKNSLTIRDNMRTENPDK